MTMTKKIAAKDVSELQALTRSVPVSEHLVNYAVKLVRSTRPGESDARDYIRNWVSWGAGPRASQYLGIAAKTRALLDGRSAPDVEDIRFAAVPVASPLAPRAASPQPVSWRRKTTRPTSGRGGPPQKSV